MSSRHILSLSWKWDILQESDSQPSTVPFQTFSLTKSLPTIASFLPPFAKEGWPRRDRQSGRGREDYSCSTDLPCQDRVSVLCAPATGTGRLGPPDLITPMTKSPELSLGKSERRGREDPGGHKTSQVQDTWRAHLPLKTSGQRTMCSSCPDPRGEQLVDRCSTFVSTAKRHLDPTLRKHFIHTCYLCW